MYRVLVVDDEKIIRNGICSAVTAGNMTSLEISAAASAAAALAFIKEKGADILITDINMPVKSGIELIEEIRKADQEMRIIVLTGYDEFEYARQCLRLNVVDFLLKPVEESVLIKILRDQLHYLEQKGIEEFSSNRRRRTQGTSEQVEMQSLLLRLVHSQMDESGLEEVEKMFSQYGYPCLQPMQLALLLPPLKSADSPESMDFFNLSLVHVCMSMVDDRDKGISFLDGDKVILLFFAGKKENEIMGILDALIEILADELGCRPRVVMGSASENYRGLALSYNDAICRLESERKDIRDAISPNSLGSRSDLFQQVFSELKSVMAVNTGNPMLILKAFSTFKKAVVSYNLSDSHVRRCCFELAAILRFSYAEDTGKTAGAELQSLMSSLTHVERDEACEIAETYIQRLYGDEEANVHSIVAKAKGYIDSNLDSDLSVASIADFLYISPNYFSRLFKRVCGEGCNEYIVRKRIDWAKSLLETTTFATGKIAVMVGYRDTNYFSLAFKKHTGESPTKYRNSMRCT
ncbi:MAG: response regulator [Clostridiales bacterium]|nr:response regulator [Clostridiales bacterium]